MTEEEIRDKLHEARRRFGLTDDTPAFIVDCPGCNHQVEVWDASDLPMGYECYGCAGTYEVQGEDEVDHIEWW